MSTEHKENGAPRNRAFWPVAIALLILLACGAILWHVWSQSQTSMRVSEQDAARIRELEAVRDGIKSLLTLPPCEAADKLAQLGLAESPRRK